MDNRDDVPSANQEPSTDPLLARVANLESENASLAGQVAALREALVNIANNDLPNLYGPDTFAARALASTGAECGEIIAAARRWLIDGADWPLVLAIRAFNAKEWKP